MQEPFGHQCREPEPFNFGRCVLDLFTTFIYEPPRGGLKPPSMPDHRQCPTDVPQSPRRRKGNNDPNLPAPPLPSLLLSSASLTQTRMPHEDTISGLQHPDPRGLHNTFWATNSTLALHIANGSSLQTHRGFAANPRCVCRDEPDSPLSSIQVYHVHLLLLPQLISRSAMRQLTPPYNPPISSPTMSTTAETPPLSS